MKKLCKKQKLIGGIAIILVAIILAIVITTNVINNNVGSESYSATAADIAKGKVAYARGERIVGTYVEPISNDDLGISATNVYYADINDDGTVDGVIFADLAVGGSGQYGTNGHGTYRIPKEDDLKSYYIKSENYTDDSFKKSGKVIAPMEENDESKNDRFYVMALNDIDFSSHYWYYNAYNNLSSSFNVSSTTNDFVAAGEEPTGRVNTRRMIASWNSSQYGAQNTRDMWGLIQDEVEEGWFVPAKSEWAAFGVAFDVTSSNYLTFGLSDYYWSSSQNSVSNIHSMYFNHGYIGTTYVNNGNFVRLATTF